MAAITSSPRPSSERLPQDLRLKSESASPQRPSKKGDWPLGFVPLVRRALICPMEPVERQIFLEAFPEIIRRSVREQRGILCQALIDTHKITAQELYSSGARSIMLRLAASSNLRPLDGSLNLGDPLGPPDPLVPQRAILNEEQVEKICNESWTKEERKTIKGFKQMNRSRLAQPLEVFQTLDMPAQERGGKRVEQIFDKAMWIDWRYRFRACKFLIDLYQLNLPEKKQFVQLLIDENILPKEECRKLQAYEPIKRSLEEQGAAERFLIRKTKRVKIASKKPLSCSY